MLIVMSTNLEYRERERHGKRESRRQDSKAQPDPLFFQQVAHI